MFDVLKRAVRAVGVYLALSLTVFVLNTGLYVAYFLATQPKYTFITGNSLLVALSVLETVGCFWFTCVRGRNVRESQDSALSAFRLSFSAMLTGTLALYGLHATVFTIVERSVSVNVIRYLVEEGPHPFADIERNFVDTFVARDRAVCKRLDEQLYLGNIAVENGRFVVTPKGRRTYASLELAHRVTADKAPKNAVTCE